MNDGPADTCGHTIVSAFWDEIATCQRPTGHEHDHMQPRSHGRYWTWTGTGSGPRPTNSLQAEADMNGLAWRTPLNEDIDWQLEDDQLDQARDQWEAEAA